MRILLTTKALEFSDQAEMRSVQVTRGKVQKEIPSFINFQLSPSLSSFPLCLLKTYSSFRSAFSFSSFSFSFSHTPPSSLTLIDCVEFVFSPFLSSLYTYSPSPYWYPARTPLPADQFEERCQCFKAGVWDKDPLVSEEALQRLSHSGVGSASNKAMCFIYFEKAKTKAKRVLSLLVRPLVVFPTTRPITFTTLEL